MLPFQKNPPNERKFKIYFIALFNFLTLDKFSNLFAAVETSP
jgi:hypothetical protein